MKILKLLNKIYFSIIFVLLVGLNSYADDKPVDIWNIDNSDNKKDSNSKDTKIIKEEKETDIKRIPPSSVDPTIKNYHWMDLVTGMLDAYEKGNDTAVLVDENNNITEGPGFNLFCINDSGIFTPDYGVLEGITRQSVFDLAKELNLPITKKSISVEELYNAEELFATSTAGGIMPITKVSDKEIGKGSAGNLTRQLHKLYWQKHSDDSWSTSISDILTN